MDTSCKRLNESKPSLHFSLLLPLSKLYGTCNLKNLVLFRNIVWLSYKHPCQEILARTRVVTESQEAALVVDRLLAQGQVNTGLWLVHGSNTSLWLASRWPWTARAWWRTSPPWCRWPSRTAPSRSPGAVLCHNLNIMKNSEILRTWKCTFVLIWWLRDWVSYYGSTVQ